MKRPELKPEEEAAFKTMYMKSLGQSGKVDNKGLVDLFFYALHNRSLQTQASLLTRLYELKPGEGLKIKTGVLEELKKATFYEDDWPLIFNLFKSEFVVGLNPQYQQFIEDTGKKPPAESKQQIVANTGKAPAQKVKATLEQATLVPSPKERRTAASLWGKHTPPNKPLPEIPSDKATKPTKKS